jgi:hypothetical protein
MPIPVQCDCGRSLRIKDELAGRKVKCPQCGAVLVVPQPEPSAEDQAFELISGDSEEEARPRGKAKSADDEGVQTAPRPRRASAAGEDEEDPEETRRKRRQREEEDREEERRRERRRKDVRHHVEAAERAERAERRRHSGYSRGGFGSMNAGVVGGIIMILIAVAWFGIGLMAGIVFFYPPILLVIGIGAIIKGLAGR